MAPVHRSLDDLERRLVVLEAQLPSQRSSDERDAVEAMHACIHELRRFIHALPAARMRYVEAEGEQAREEAHLALRRLIHDLRTPAGVLYTYLRLIVAGMIFAEARADQRNEAVALVELIREIRDTVKAEL